MSKYPNKHIPNGGEINQGNTNGESSIRINNFDFPIRNPGYTFTNQMKNIPHSALPNFHGMASEGPYTFLFEFNVLCRSYDYVIEQHKLKLFLATLKIKELRWFMGLGGDNIVTWAQMKKVFLDKYQEFFKFKDRKEAIFKMTQQEDENLEDYVERFQYNLQRSRHNGLNDDTLKIMLLRGIRDDCIDLLNLMGTRDVSLLKYVELCDLCRRYSRNASIS